MVLIRETYKQANKQSRVNLCSSCYLLKAKLFQIQNKNKQKVRQYISIYWKIGCE